MPNCIHSLEMKLRETLDDELKQILTIPRACSLKTPSHSNHINLRSLRSALFMAHTGRTLILPTMRVPLELPVILIQWEWLIQIILEIVVTKGPGHPIL